MNVWSAQQNEHVRKCVSCLETLKLTLGVILRCSIIIFMGVGGKKKIYLLRRNGNELKRKKVRQQDSFQVDHNQVHDPLSL